MRRIAFSVCMSVAAGGGALVAVSPAGAQETCYKITDLGALGFTPGSANVFGINNNDEAVFTAMVGGKKHAMLYLPAAAYNLTAGCHDLHSLAGLHADAQSATYEINDQGMAAGWADIQIEPGVFEQHALVWKINDYNPLIPPLPTIDLTTFNILGPPVPALQVPTVAWAINNAVPPVVVGDASGLTNCECPPDQNGVCTILGFTAVLDVNEVVKVLLPIFGVTCDFQSHGRDISSLAVGYSDTPFGGACVGNGGNCANSKDAVHFLSGGAPVALTDLSTGGSESRGVNDDTSIVGWGYNSGIPQCERRALYWTVPADPAPTILPTEQSGDQAWAEAINNLGLPQVVGWNETTGQAVLWECHGPDCDNPLHWSVTDLNNTIQDCSPNWSLVQAYDLTDAATPSIVGWGLRSGVRHGFLLTPLPNCCASDLDGNGTVGASDLLLLLANWGACADCDECGGAACLGDLDCDCSVGGSDLLILEDNWGPCDGSGGGTTLQQAVQEMGFPSMAAHQAWLAQASEPQCFASGCLLYTILQD